MSKITYQDKVALNINSNIADINKVNASDMNEIKIVVNGIDDEVVAMQNYSTISVTKNDTYVRAIDDNISYRVGNLVFVNLLLQPENVTMGTGEYTFISGLPAPVQQYQFFAGEYTSGGNALQRFFIDSSGNLKWWYNSQFENSAGWRIAINLVYLTEED